MTTQQPKPTAPLSPIAHVERRFLSGYLTGIAAVDYLIGFLSIHNWDEMLAMLTRNNLTQLFLSRIKYLKADGKLSEGQLTVVETMKL